ncbi:phosphoglycolate phosphatase [Breoghania corrubedonensis]|uniref:Phosphoglycolate phosphatase n=1 Tax=Breoghania corrubedonensis TaxID=665038 RepID=A0A2T5VAY2_9HYPH|nr:phosphoglycolate phosphatase [Breoghania corrubedonensis]PTW60909.1 phosphoglycolate phosphatase [Breoghania corrubedonensis]
MPAPILVFDLDGTLVDTAPDLLASLNTVLEARSLGPIPMDGLSKLVGQGARVMLQRGFDMAGEHLDPAEMEVLFSAFLEHYSQNIAVASRPFPGMETALDRFSEAGWKLAVCTNKLEGLARKLLEELGMTSRFATIIGGDTFAKPKPDAMPILGAIDRCGGDPSRALMVGDSITDIDAARAARIPVIAVDFGYTPVPVTELGPDRVISSFDALWPAVQDLAGTETAQA